MPTLTFSFTTVMKIFNRKVASSFLFLAVLILVLVGMSGCIQQHQANPIPGLTTIPSVALLIPRNANSLPIAEKNDLTSLKSVLTIAGIRFTEVSDSALKACSLSGSI